MLARNTPFARLAVSAASFAAFNSAGARGHQCFETPFAFDLVDLAFGDVGVHANDACHRAGFAWQEQRRAEKIADLPVGQKDTELGWARVRSADGLIVPFPHARAIVWMDAIDPSVERQRSVRGSLKVIQIERALVGVETAVAEIVRIPKCRELPGLNREP